MVATTIDVAFVAAGFLVGSVRTHTGAEPVLPWRYYGSLKGGSWRWTALHRMRRGSLWIKCDFEGVSADHTNGLIIRTLFYLFK